ncbi:hypothetical protein WOLCODRAFT_78423 [Wolfiporia cocos MD-104 SS10]|uniref:Uncharacterized protein n=1 Tax=Wolfiporia cocos (strain MD-104) TaxID=742152 RepID=A0A2H3K701_WOLCO|nr:hypothetical protein WOLCODRAFT_78423 [Wolfiporia cocos MD-104 SS10]
MFFARSNSSQAPALEAVEHTQVVLNGTLTFPSIYRGEPSASVDAAWDQITKNVKFSVITEDDLTKIGQTVRPSTVRIDEKFGGGILAGFELGHQMHCLNMLRKHTYIDYYGPLNQDYLDNRIFYRIHLCLQSIMCTGDVGLITFDWVEGYKRSYPNFNTRHICRDSSKLYQWIEQAPHVPAAHVYRTMGTVDLPDSP